MSTVLSSGTTTLTPVAVTDYSATQTAGTIVHPILGRASPDVTLRPAALRSGNLTLVYFSETAAEAARVALTSGAGTWQLASAERPTINMRFAALDVGRTLGDAKQWTITVRFQEIVP